MRHLASIQQITDIRPIEGKDRIVQGHVNGWNLIIKKDEFQDGDRCVYCEIDSVLPERPEFEFLRKNNFRIRTMKLSGVRSEGICFPLTVLPAREKPYEIGEDVTDLMGITKWEPQEDEERWNNPKTEPRKKTFWEKLPFMRFRWYRQLFGQTKKAKRGWPEQIPVTDEERIQNCSWVLKDKETKWLLSEKCDGTSASYLLLRHRHRIRPDTFEFIVCSRKLRLARDNSHYWFVADKYHIEEVLRGLIGKMDWVAIQGEILGPKIQKNKYGFAEHCFYPFNLLAPDPATGKCHRMDSVSAAVVLKNRGMNFVPIIETDLTLPDTVDEVLAMAHGQSVLGDTLREGIVFRSMDGQQSFKAVDPEFLIHYNL